MDKAIIAVLEKTDWTLLSVQKAELIALLAATPFSADPQPLEGLLNWIDAIHDAANLDGFPVVFLTEGEPCLTCGTPCSDEGICPKCKAEEDEAVAYD